MLRDFAPRTMESLLAVEKYLDIEKDMKCYYQRKSKLESIYTMNSFRLYVWNRDFWLLCPVEVIL